jgi:hypothetical protein
MLSAVVSLRAMFSLLIVDTNTNPNLTNSVMGLWWLSGEQEQVQPH